MLKAFSGSFFLATGIATFILLIQYLLKYFDDLVGKNLGASVFSELLFYFSLNMLQNAFPLGVLVSSLMVFGNLGEYFELTAIKSAGISLVRILMPVFFFVALVAVGMFFFNNYIIPATNLKAYSLLYDIKQTKPALDINEGAFYNGIPDYSIKVKEKFPDGKTLKDIMIYDHSQGRENYTVILADSSLMYTILNDKYLKLELFDGNYFSQESKSGSEKIDQLNRTNFQKMDLVFNLSSFDLKRRKEELFQNNRRMKNIKELKHAVDSFKNEVMVQKSTFLNNASRYYGYHLASKNFISPEGLKKNPLNIRPPERTYRFQQEKRRFPSPEILYENAQNPGLKKSIKTTEKPIVGTEMQKDSLLSPTDKQADSLKAVTDSLALIESYKKINLDSTDLDTLTFAHLEKYLKVQQQELRPIAENALRDARNVKVNLATTKNVVYRLKRDINRFTIEKEKKYALPVACLLMFMIGAPLGAIIKKGGLGVPVIIAIFFFIMYYIVGSIGNQQSKELQLNPYIAVWIADAVLLPFGLFFVKQARVDARLFEVDNYLVWFEKLTGRFAKNAK